MRLVMTGVDLQNAIASWARRRIPRPVEVEISGVLSLMMILGTHLEVVFVDIVEEEES